MAPTTRRVSEAAASAAASGPCRLLALSDDVVSVVAHELCDPLRPLLAVNLSSTAKGLRAAMQSALAELQLQRVAAEALAALCRLSLVQLRDATQLVFGQAYRMPLSLAHWRTLGTLVGCRSLPRLERLYIRGADNGGQGVALLAAGLRRRESSLINLTLVGTQIEDEGAVALASGLTERALPALKDLDLEGNRLGDAGLAALAPALRQLPGLAVLSLDHNQIGDRGVASLLAEPLQDALPSLHTLWLHDNLITDRGCAGLAAKLCTGAPPELRRLSVSGNPASEEAQKALLAIRRLDRDVWENIDRDLRDI